MSAKQARFAKLVLQFQKAEADLVRATRKWDRLRQRVRRAERELEKDFSQRAKIGGKADWRDFGDKV